MHWILWNVGEDLVSRTFRQLVDPAILPLFLWLHRLSLFRMTYRPKILLGTQFARRNINLSLLRRVWVGLSYGHINLLIHIVGISLLEFLFQDFTLIETLFRAWSCGYLRRLGLAQLLFINFNSTFLLLKCISRSEYLGYLDRRSVWWLRKISKNWISTLSWGFHHVLMV